jgi:hypothetical protein
MARRELLALRMSGDTARLMLQAAALVPLGRR